jgi:hypothetical protein
MKARLLSTSPFLAVVIAMLALIAPRPSAPTCHEDRGTWLCDISPAKVDTHIPSPVGRQAVLEKEKLEHGPDNQPSRLAQPLIVHPPVDVGHSSRAAPANNHLARLHSGHTRHLNYPLVIRADGDGEPPNRISGIEHGNSQWIYEQTRANYAGKPGLGPPPYGDPSPSYTNESERLDPWHGYDSRDGPGNGY